MQKLLIPLFSLALMAQAPAPAPAPMNRPPAMMGHGMGQNPAAEAPEPKESDVIAYVGTRPVTYGEFSTWLRVMAGPRAEMLRKNPASRGQAHNFASARRSPGHKHTAGGIDSEARRNCGR